MSGIGAGKINMSITVPRELDAVVKRLAHASGMSRNRYLLMLLDAIMQSEARITSAIKIDTAGTPLLARVADARRKYAAQTRSDVSKDAPATGDKAATIYPPARSKKRKKD
jgi:hypothetical protein